MARKDELKVTFDRVKLLNEVEKELEKEEAALQQGREKYRQAIISYLEREHRRRELITTPEKAHHVANHLPDRFPPDYRAVALKRNLRFLRATAGSELSLTLKEYESFLERRGW